MFISLVMFIVGWLMIVVGVAVELNIDAGLLLNESDSGSVTVMNSVEVSRSLSSDMCSCSSGGEIMGLEFSDCF